MKLSEGTKAALIGATIMLIFGLMAILIDGCTTNGANTDITTGATTINGMTTQPTYSYDCAHNVICYYDYGLTCVYVPNHIKECGG